MDTKAIISEAATRYGLDPDTALRVAAIETGGTFDPRAQNPSSSAGGLFQFLDATWKQYGNGKHKYDPYANADAGMRFMRDNIKALRTKLGREPTAGEVYLAHQQGAGGASLILSNPSANAIALLGRDKVKLNGGNESMTAGDFASLWDKKIANAPGMSTSLVSGMAPSGSMANSNDSQFSVDQAGAVSYVDVVTPENFTQEEKDRQAAEDEEKAYGLVEGAGAAIWNEWSVLAPFRAIGGYDPDPNFKVTEDLVKDYGRDIPDQYLDEFEDSVSEQHMQAIRDRLMTQMEVNEKLAAMGGTGIALQMGAAFTDPAAIGAAIAIGAATGGTALPAAIAARAGRLGLVGLGAAEGAIGNVIVDSALVAVDPTRDAADTLGWSVGTGLVMGGAFGALRRNPNFQAEADAFRQIGTEMQGEVVDREVAKLTQGGRNDGIGAQRAGLGEASFRADTDDQSALWSRIAEKTTAMFGNARFDVVGQMLKSKSPMVRGLARYLGEDAVRASDGQITQMSATERLARYNRAATTNWSYAMSKSWKKYRRANKIGFWDSSEGLVKFKSQVTEYIREVDPQRKAQYPAAVQEAGLAFDKGMKAFWKKAKDLGLTRSDDGVENYFPRYADLNKSSKMISEFGYSRDFNNGGLASVFREAIRKAQPTMDPKLAHSMGYAMVDRFHKLHAGENMMRQGLFDLDDLETVLDDLGMSPDDVLIAKEWMARNQPDKANPDAGGNSRLKHRVIMDENMEFQVQDRYGITRKVKISDFYINDPHLAFNMYSRQMSGQIAMAEIKVHDPDTGELVLDGIKSAADWEKLKAQALGVGQKFGANNDADMKNLDFMYSAITGTPYRSIDEADDWSTTLRMLRDFNFFRLMGQVGFAQLPELGRATASVGIKTMYDALPSFREIIDAVRNGTMVDELAEELMESGGYGSDWLRTSFYIELDDFGTPITHGGDTTVQRIAKKVQPIQHKMNRAVNAMSFMAPINAGFQKWASRAFAVKFAKMALKGDKSSLKRLAALGLSESDVDDIFVQINRHSKFKNMANKKGGQLKKLGLRDWDGNVAAKFEDALFRMSRTMILENDPGQYAKWMNHPLGKVFIQFRSFALASWTKATLQGLNMRDAEAALSLMYSSMIGTLVYAGQTHLNMIGRPDKEEQLAEKLTWGKLAMAGFSRTSESSLVPFGIDVMSNLLTGEPLMDFRSSGTTTQFDNLFGNPTGDLIATAGNGIAGVMSTITKGDDFSAPDFRNLTRAFTPSRLMGVAQFYNWLGSGLPQREMRD